MLQRTLITNKADELSACMEEIGALPEFGSGGDKLLLFSAPGADGETLKARIESVRRALPEVKAVGMAAPANGGETGCAPEGGAYSFLLMEQAKAEILHYDCREISAQEAGRRFHRELSAMEDVAAVLLFTAGVEREIDGFLEPLMTDGRSEIPVFGAQSGAEHPYICGSFLDGEPDDRGVAAIALRGRGLSVRYSYDMGWKPVGGKMRITGMDGQERVISIDGVSPIDIYREYLGVEPDEHFAANAREFPFVVRRGERLAVRTPSGCGERGVLTFAGRVREGETAQLSYADPRRLIEDTKACADSMRAFGPQALFLFACENRVRFLAEQGVSDVDAYRAAAPQPAWMRGCTAILLDGKGGGVVDSAVVSVGMCETEDEAGCRELSQPAAQMGGVISRERRLEKLLDRLTRDLAPEEAPLPEWLTSLPLIDVEKGMKSCGGSAEYMEALSLFGRSIGTRAEEIERFWRAKDYDAYAIKVQNLKSLADSIGATELSQLAAELSAAGRIGDEASVEVGTDTMLTLYRSLAEPMARLHEGEDEMQPEVSEAPQDDAVPARRRKILLADDDDDFCALVGRWLKKDYEVTTVNSGRKALKVLKEEIPELLLLDFDMSEMSGAEVLHRIRSDPWLKDLAVVFLTGAEDKENVQKTESLRPKGFLLKTMGKAGLLMGIEAFLNKE